MAETNHAPSLARPNGYYSAALEGPCARLTCSAMKKHALAMAQEIEVLTLERDALRRELQDRRGVDWSPLGGERVMRALSPTEARIAECLLLAGAEQESGGFRTAKYGAILRYVWGDAYAFDREERHMIRVNASRLRHKLRGFGWDVRTVTGYGMRLVPWEGEPAPMPAEAPTAGRPLSPGERAEILMLWGQGFRVAYIKNVTGRADRTIRDVVLAAHRKAS